MKSCWQLSLGKVSIARACVLKRELQQTVCSFGPVLRENTEIYIELSFNLLVL